ncbi:MAG: DUF1566 domain-containing protein [Pseudomonadota bacterium]|nr:DUF1566 domain-containing protein [Pseudomonadota bacterium]
MITPLATAQTGCYDLSGREIPCAGSGQDAEWCSGMGWPDPRFIPSSDLVQDRLTGLFWTRDANIPELPMTWAEAFAYVAHMNRTHALGYDDWRLPNRRELRSLVSHQTSRPALPTGHPFTNIFPGWYWTSTTAAISPAHAWYVHMEGARMFYGGKDQSFLVWPVRGTGGDVLPATGQRLCYDGRGMPVPCAGSGQDGETHYGRPWPAPRFRMKGVCLLDGLTGLGWRRDTDLTRGPVAWEDALAAVERLNAGRKGTQRCWRLPNINELESLVDCAEHSPALPREAAFETLCSGYWSSTTSAFEPDWAWALYLDKGAVGVGQKAGAHFHAWAVRGE